LYPSPDGYTATLSRKGRGKKSGETHVGGEGKEWGSLQRKRNKEIGSEEMIKKNIHIFLALQEE